MRVASFLMDMTPSSPFYLIGYGDRFQSRREPAKGVHDPIYANAMLLEVDGKEIYIYNVDFIELLEDFCLEMKQELHQRFGISQDHILLSVTHNHQSVRDYHHTWETGEYNATYEDFLKESIYHGYEECKARLVEVEAYFGKEVVEGFYGNRNHPGLPADNEIIKVEFFHHGTAVGGIINWAVHSTVLSPENDQLSAELAGNVRRYVAQQSGYVPLMIVGAAADCSTRLYHQGTDFEELNRVSKALAQRILKIKATTLLNVRFESTQTAEERIHYNMDDHKQELLASIEKAKALSSDKGAKIEGVSPGFYIKCMKKKLDVGIVDILLSSTIIHLQDVILVSIPGELGSKFGLELKQLLPDACVLIFGYTNGFLHYMMPAQEYGLSMETMDSLYPKGSIEPFVEKIKNKIKTK